MLAVIVRSERNERLSIELRSTLHVFVEDPLPSGLMNEGRFREHTVEVERDAIESFRVWSPSQKGGRQRLALNASNPPGRMIRSGPGQHTGSRSADCQPYGRKRAQPFEIQPTPDDPSTSLIAGWPLPGSQMYGPNSGCAIRPDLIGTASHCRSSAPLIN